MTLSLNTALYSLSLFLLSFLAIDVTSDDDALSLIHIQKQNTTTIIELKLKIDIFIISIDIFISIAAFRSKAEADPTTPHNNHTAVYSDSQFMLSLEQEPNTGRRE